MDSGITTFTALRLNDKDVNDPNSGFYTTQATREQIDAIPDNAKEPGELIYDKTSGSLVLYSQAEDEEVGVWKTLTTTTDTEGNIVINSYPTAPTEPTEGEIYYNSTDGTLQVYLNGSWQIITTSGSGEIIAKSHSTSDAPSSPPGLIYYNTDDLTLKVRDERALSPHTFLTIVTTTDDNGYLVVQKLDSTHTPVDHNGLIYYDDSNHNFKVRENNIINTIVTTPDSAGNLGVKSLSSSVDPTGTDGQIYYNTQDKAFRGYSDGAWNYFSTKPQIFTHFYYGYPFPGRNEDVVGLAPTTIPAGHAYIEVNGYNGEDGYVGDETGTPDSDLDVVVSPNSFLFTTYGTSGIKFTGHYDTPCQIVISISGGCAQDGLGDTILDFQAYKAHEDGSNSTVIDYARLRMEFKNSAQTPPPLTDELRFGHTFTTVFPVMILKVSHVSSPGSVELLIHDYSVSCTS